MAASTHEREATSRQPVASSVTKDRRSSTAPRRHPHAHQEGAAHREADAVRCEGPARPDGGHHRAGQQRPEDVSRALRDADQGVRLLEPLPAHHLRHEADGRRREEGRGAAHHHRQADQVPDLAVAGDEDGGDDRLGEGAHRVAGDHQRAARQPVRPDAAREHQDDARDGEGGEHETQIARAAAHLQDGEGERHADQRIAQR